MNVLGRARLGCQVSKCSEHSYTALPLPPPSACLFFRLRCLLYVLSEASARAMQIKAVVWAGPDSNVHCVNA